MTTPYMAAVRTLAASARMLADGLGPAFNPAAFFEDFAAELGVYTFDGFRMAHAVPAALDDELRDVGLGALEIHECPSDMAIELARQMADLTLDDAQGAEDARDKNRAVLHDNLVRTDTYKEWRKKTLIEYNIDPALLPDKQPFG